MFKIIEQVHMKDGKEVQPIEIREDGVAIYPQGTVIKATAVQQKKKATVKKQSSNKIEIDSLVEPDTFENGYGWKKVEKEIEDYKDSQYKQRMNYLRSEEGQIEAENFKKLP